MNALKLNLKLQLSDARNLISDGFTIQNRRSLQTLIGKKEMQQLGDAYVKLRERKLTFFEDKLAGIVGKIGLFKLDIVEGRYVLSYKSNIAGIHSEIAEHKLENENISLKNIMETILRYKAEYIDSRVNASPLLPKVLEESETMKLLYSDKFKFPQGINKDGYYMTTVIDKETKEPVQAFLEIKNEYYRIFVKDSKGNYEEIGYYYVDLDKHTGVPIKCMYINSEEGNNRYIGIGLRLHQIAIEKILQARGKGISLEAGPEAFPFHYKCGFRVNPKTDKILSTEACNEILSRYEEKFGISRSILETVLKKRNFNGFEGYGEYETKQELAKLLYLQNKFQYGNYTIPMELSPEALKMWSERIKLQPILGTMS